MVGASEEGQGPHWAVVPLMMMMMNLGLTPPGTYNLNARGSDACRGSNSLWTRTLYRYTRAGLHECMVSTMSVPPPKTIQDREQTKDTHPIPGHKLKFLTPPGIELEPPDWKAGTLPTTPRRRIFTELFKFKTSDSGSGSTSTSCLRSHTDPFAFFTARCRELQTIKLT